MILLVLALGVSGCASAQKACPTAASYIVQPLDADTFRIEADITSPASQLDLFYFPIDARSQGQAESIRNLQGFSAAGDAV